MDMKTWDSELESIGLSKEVFEAIMSAAPALEIAVGYPQELTDYFTVEQNW